MQIDVIRKGYRKVTMKLSLCLIKHHAVQACGKMDVNCYALLNLGKLSAACPGTFHARQKPQICTVLEAG